MKLSSKVLILLFSLSILIGYSNWWEELSEENTKQDKKKIEQAALQEAPTKESVARPKIDPELMKYAVSLLETVLNAKEGTVKLSWMDISDPSAKYKIYRADAPIRNGEVLSKAQYLGVVESGVQQFNDRLEKGGTYYYGVLTEVGGKLKEVFAYEQSYTSQPIVHKVDDASLNVSQLKAVYNKFLSTIFLRWDNPETTLNYQILVYTSTRPMLDYNALVTSKLLAILDKGEEKYQDSSMISGRSNHYVVVIKKEGKKEPEEFYQMGVNHTTTPIFTAEKGNKIDFSTLPTETEKPVEPTSTPVESPPPISSTQPQTPPIKDPEPTKAPAPGTPNPFQILQGAEFESGKLVENKNTQQNQKKVFFTRDFEVNYNEKENYISLLWRIPDKISSPFYLNIYRSEKNISSISEIQNSATMLENLRYRENEPAQRYEYRDFDITPGKSFYYAILIDTGEGLDEQKLLLLDNYIKYPIRIPGTLPNSTNLLGSGGGANPLVRNIPGESDADNINIKSELKTLVKNEFLGGHYLYIISRVTEILKKKGLDDENKKIGYLFLGRSYLALGKKELALEQFYNLRIIDDVAGEFWIEKTVERF